MKKYTSSNKKVEIVINHFNLTGSKLGLHTYFCELLLGFYFVL